MQRCPLLQPMFNGNICWFVTTSTYVIAKTRLPYVNTYMNYTLLLNELSYLFTTKYCYIYLYKQANNTDKLSKLDDCKKQLKKLVDNENVKKFCQPNINSTVKKLVQHCQAVADINENENVNPMIIVKENTFKTCNKLVLQWRPGKIFSTKKRKQKV